MQSSILNYAMRSDSSKLTTLAVVLVLLVGAGLPVIAAADANRAFAVPAPGAGDESITRLLQAIRLKFDLPAMAAATVTQDGLKAAGTVGVRKQGTNIPVTLDDQWHLGSDTKAMTATLVARLVEQGRLKWDQTLADTFRDLAPEMNPEFHKITLLHLLSHRAGLPANLDLVAYAGDDVRALRLRAVREGLARAPLFTPGTTNVYSNLGYIIAGAVVEQVTGKTWEQLMQEELFGPLGITSAGFGGTGTPGKVDQPWPHSSSGKPTPMNGPAVDNPPVMGPAGRVHCTIQDWAKFVQDQLRGARGEAGLLKPESYRKLRIPPFGGEYAPGWIVVERGWGGGLVLHHVGDNTMNCASVWIAPERDFAILVCVNQGGDRAFQATDAAVAALIPLANTKANGK